LAETYRDKGLVVLAVNVMADTASDVRSYAAEKRLRQTFLLGGGEVARRYGVRAAPTTFRIDPAGDIVGSRVGFSESEFPKIEAEVKALLPKSP
jgi:hypothetical protein